MIKRQHSHTPSFTTLFWGVALILAAIILLPHVAYAVADGTSESFRCVNGVASGKLYASGGAPTVLRMDNLFSFLVGNMEQLSSNLMGQMYCGMVQSLTPYVLAMATLAVMFFGISFTIGVVPITGQDAIVFLLKVAFITGFATNADLLIGVGYSFLIGGIKQGVTTVLAGLGGTMSTGDSVFSVLDKFMATVIHYATDNVGAKDPNTFCKNALFAVLATMAIAFPVIAYLCLALIVRLVVTVFRAVFAYIYALIGITFLLTLAPFFISFYFFRQTSAFFDKWLAYLVSFTLQVVLIFAFLAFILMLNTKSIVSNLPEIIMYQEQTVESTAMRFPWEYCTLCDFKIVDKTTGAEITDSAPNFIKDGQLRCKEPKEAIKPSHAVSPESQKKQVSALLTLAGNGILALIILAVIVERLLAQVPYLAQRLGSNLGASSAAQLAGGTPYGNAPVLRMPGESLMGDFTKGFNQGFGDRSNADGISKTIQGVRDGISGMISGTTSKGDSLRDEYGRKVDGGVSYQWRRFLSDPNRMGDN